MKTRKIVIMTAILMTLFCRVGPVRAGVLYSDPPGGWTYTYTADAAVAGPTDFFDSLDGTWDHNSIGDAWDGSVIGAGNPGGASCLNGFLRIQDTGDPRDYGMLDPSNRKVSFAHSITNDIGAAGSILSGVTLSFRARIATSPPLDDLHLDGGSGIVPWPAGGDGYVIHSSGNGNIGIRQSDGDQIISLSLALRSEPFVGLTDDGLLMNGLNGNVPTGVVDTGEPGTTLNMLPLDPTVWHEYWITIETDYSGTGTHIVKVYLDGSLSPTVFFVTAGTGYSYYEDNYLAIGNGSTGQSGAFDIDFISYVPGVVTPVSATSSVNWAALTIDSEGQVGGYTSLALDGSGNPAVSYFDAINHVLKYAFWNGTDWDIRTVDDSSEWVGMYTSVVFDSSDHPCISYYDDTNGCLKYAAWNGSSWDIQVIDSGVRLGMYASLALDSSGNPAVAYHDNGNADLKYAAFDGTNWNIQIVDSVGYVGYYASLALDGDDNPHISYRDYPNGILKYAYHNGTGWLIQTVDSDGDVGFSTSIAVDYSGNPHISYRDNTNLDLKYAAWDGAGWEIETVDSSGDTGRWTSIALDSAGNPRISYHDNTNGDLKYASFNGLYWTIQTVDSDGDVGDYTSIELDSADKPLISYFDSTNGDLKLAVTCVPVPGDVNADCRINLLDIAELAGRWLECSVPFDKACL